MNHIIFATEAGTHVEPDRGKGLLGVICQCIEEQGRISFQMYFQDSSLFMFGFMGCGGLALLWA